MEGLDRPYFASDPRRNEVSREVRMEDVLVEVGKKGRLTSEVEEDIVAPGFRTGSVTKTEDSPARN